MCDALQVRWTIIAKNPPQPWLACSGCGGLKPFRPSGKFRLNANGRKLDAWLIYTCSDCDKRWNRSLFERRNVNEIDPALLAALQSNDPQWARAEAFNLDALRRKSQRIDEFPDAEIVKEIVRDGRDRAKIAIELVVPFPTSTRLDRLLASELALPRARIQVLQDRGMLWIRPERSDALRRRVKTGTIAVLDLSAEIDDALSWRLRVIGTTP